MQYNTMNLSTFLAHYFGIQNDKLNKLKHKDIVGIFPLQRSSFEAIRKNPELVHSGQIVVVKDSKGESIPYIAPKVSYMSYSGSDAIVNYNPEVNYDINDINVRKKFEKYETNINISREYSDVTINIEENNIKIDKRTKNEILSQIHSMTDWELKELLMKYKPYYSIYNAVKKEFQHRKKSKVYTKSKKMEKLNKIILRECGEEDY